MDILKSSYLENFINTVQETLHGTNINGSFSFRQQVGYGGMQRGYRLNAEFSAVFI
jgi:hypothetical protein